MNIPEHLWRFPTSQARESLATRFNLPYNSQMQDWEYEISDTSRISEFLASYKSDILTDDEKFSLMEIIVDSFSNLEEEISNDIRWKSTLQLIKKNLDIHIYSVWYWSNFEEPHEFHYVSRYMKEIRENFRARYA